MRRTLLLTLCLLLTGAAQVMAKPIEFPPLTGRVVDSAGLLDAGTIQQLTEKLAAHETATGQQVVVVTVPDLQGREIEDYGYQLGRTWGIGQKGKDNGALLIVAPKERAVRIEVGYGLEDQLTDALSRLIVERSILPQFKAGDYPGGIVAGTDAILAALSGGALPAELKQAPESDGMPLSVIVPIIILFLILRLFARRGTAGGALPFLLGGLLGGRRRSGDDDSFGGGFSGGGGSFGGGGASGRW